MNYLEVILTLLTIVGGLLTIATFTNNRNKDSKSSGEQTGAMSQKLDDITRRLEEIQADVREVRKGEEQTGKEVIAIRESTKSAHKRIDSLEKRLQVLIDGREAV